MASLAEQRRAIGAGITASRQATAGAERRAIGAAMEASRRGTLKNDLNALETSPRKSGQLRTLERKGARPATSGVGYWNPSRVPSSGAGIASPLVEGPGTGETAVFARTYHDTATTVVTTDGLIALEVLQVDTIIMHDANGGEVVMRFAQMPEPEAP